jgi:hypothetical protein
MSALKSRGASIGDIKRRLAAMPATVALKVAQKAAPALTGQVQASHKSLESAYGNPYPAGVDVYESGATRQMLRFAANGRVVRVVLGKPYQKYLIGKYAILPQGKRAMPAAWSRELAELSAATLREEAGKK